MRVSRLVCLLGSPAVVWAAARPLAFQTCRRVVEGRCETTTAPPFPDETRRKIEKDRGEEDGWMVGAGRGARLLAGWRQPNWDRCSPHPAKPRACLVYNLPSSFLPHCSAMDYNKETLLLPVQCQQCHSSGSRFGTIHAKRTCVTTLSLGRTPTPSNVKLKTGRSGLGGFSFRS